MSILGDDEIKRALLDDGYIYAPDSALGPKGARILRAATELFVARGYRRTSVDEIARRAAVAKGTVYLYFPRKTALLLYALASERGRLVRSFGSLAASIPDGARLHHFLVLMLTAHRDGPLMMRLLSGDAELRIALDELGEEVVSRSRSRARERLVELIGLAGAGALTLEEKEARADILLGLAYEAPRVLDPQGRGGRPLDDAARLLADMLVLGMARKPRPSGPR